MKTFLKRQHFLDLYLWGAVGVLAVIFFISLTVCFYIGQNAWMIGTIIAAIASAWITKPILSTAHAKHTKSYWSAE